MKINLFFYSLATLSLSRTAVSVDASNLRDAAVKNNNDLVTSDAPLLSSGSSGLSSKIISDRPQCNFEAASLNVGDVQIELPGGKVGFEAFPNCTTVFSSEYLDELGVDSSTCIMSVQQLIKAGYTISRFSEYMPPEALDYLEYIQGPLSSGRAGMITCDVSSGKFAKTYSRKSWRPYKMTEGWQYVTMTECNDDGWVGFGGDDGSNIDVKHEGKLSFASQKSRNGNAFISMISASYHVGNAGEEATKACCSPEPGVPRDCSVVYAMIESFDVSSISKDTL